MKKTWFILSLLFVLTLIPAIESKAQTADGQIQENVWVVNDHKEIWVFRYSDDDKSYRVEIRVDRLLSPAQISAVTSYFNGQLSESKNCNNNCKPSQFEVNKFGVKYKVASPKKLSYSAVMLKLRSMGIIMKDDKIVYFNHPLGC